MDLLLHGVPPDDFDPGTLRFCIEESKNYIEADRDAQLIKQLTKSRGRFKFFNTVTHKADETN